MPIPIDLLMPLVYTSETYSPTSDREKGGGKVMGDQDSSQQPTWLDLYDYRRRVAAMYQQREEALRNGSDELSVWQQFRAQKDALFAHHPQSALTPEQRQHFTGLSYFPYDPLLRVEATLTPEVAEE